MRFLQNAAYLIRSQRAYERVLNELAAQGYRYANGQPLETKPVFTNRIVLVTENGLVTKRSIEKYNGDAMYHLTNHHLYVVD